MIIDTKLDFIANYIESLNTCLQRIGKHHKFSVAQGEWFKTVFMGILLTNNICWAKMARASLGTYSTAALSWMFCHTKVVWDQLLQASVLHILNTYNITKGILVLDDTEKQRSRRTRRISGVHKMKNKKTGGFFNGQSIVQLLLVTDRFTVPVGFQFYTPDPAIAKYKKQLAKYKKTMATQGLYERKLLSYNEFSQQLLIGFATNDFIAYEAENSEIMIYDVEKQKHKHIVLKKAKNAIIYNHKQKTLTITYNKMSKLFSTYSNRFNIDKPELPSGSIDYPTKLEIGTELINQFTQIFPDIIIKATVMDAGYCKRLTMSSIAEYTKQTQVITQIRSNQLVIIDNKEVQVKYAFDHSKDICITTNLRHNEQKITYSSIKATVKSHDSKYNIIALKYANETDYRYLIANDSTWRDIDIIKVYALRWLVEVFFQDWKSNEGYGGLAMQRGDEGSLKVVILSLLIDHIIILHPDQHALFKHNRPAATVGSMRQKIIVESLLSFIQTIIYSANPKDEFDKYSKSISDIFKLMPSKKHMRDLNFDDFEPEEKNVA